jgi:hypothetical protein
MVGKGDEDEMKKEKPTKHQKECPICMSKKDMPDEFWSNEPDIYADLISPIGSFRNRIPNPSPELSFNTKVITFEPLIPDQPLGTFHP